MSHAGLVLGIGLFWGCWAGIGVQAAKPWVEVQSPHFTVVTNAGVKTGRRVALQFEQVRAVFAEMFPAFRLDPGKPFLIFAARNQKTMKRLLPRYWRSGKAKKPSGAFQRGIERHYAIVLADGFTDTYRIVFHEYVHLLNRMNFPYLPLWMDEGLAEFFEVLTIRKDRVIIGNPHGRHVFNLYRRPLLPFEEFLAADHASPYYQEKHRATFFYGQAWAFTHYLVLAPEAQERQMLSRFLQLMSDNIPAGTAMAEAFGDFKELERALRAYITRRRFPSLELVVPLKLKAQDFPSRTLEDYESGALLSSFLTAGGEFLSAKPLLEKAEAVAGDSLAVMESRALYHLRESRFQKALQVFQAILAVDGGHVIAHYYAGLLLSAYGGAGDALTRAQAHLEKAIAIAPGFAPAYSQLGWVYSRDPQKLLQALPMVLKAVALEKGMISHRFHLFQVLVNLGQIDDAIANAQLMLHMADNRKDRQAIYTLLESAAAVKSTASALENVP